MVTDSSAPATKLDIQMLMESIGKFYMDAEKWKNEIIEKNDQWKEELKLHFDAAVENIRHDLVGAHKDDISSVKDVQYKHETLLVRLERHAGFSSRKYS